jgi:hypothetical protein
MVLDIVGKEVAEGLDEPDSIEATQQSQSVESTQLAETPKASSDRKRRQTVSFRIVFTIYSYFRK